MGVNWWMECGRIAPVPHCVSAHPCLDHWPFDRDLETEEDKGNGLVCENGFFFFRIFSEFWIIDIQTVMLWWLVWIYGSIFGYDGDWKAMSDRLICLVWKDGETGEVGNNEMWFCIGMKILVTSAGWNTWVKQRGYSDTKVKLFFTYLVLSGHGLVFVAICWTHIVIKSSVLLFRLDFSLKCEVKSVRKCYSSFHMCIWVEKKKKRNEQNNLPNDIRDFPPTPVISLSMIEYK